MSEYGVKILLPRIRCLIPGSRMWQSERDNLVLTEAMYDEFRVLPQFDHFWYTSTSSSPG